SVLAALALRMELRNHHWEKRHYDLAAGAVVGSALLFGLPPALIFFLHHESKPHLAVMARSPNPGKPDFVAYLTNDFFYFKPGAKFASKNIEGVLFWQISNRIWRVFLRFGLKND